LFVSIVNNGILPVGEEKTVQRNLAVRTAYKNRDGNAIDVTSLIQGTDFVAEVTITNTTANAIKDMALMEIFPSGWEIVNTRFTDFGDFAPNESRTFRVLLNASYLGRYYLPGVQAEAMYDNDYEVRTKGKWVVVAQ